MIRRRPPFMPSCTAWLQCIAVVVLWLFAHGASAANAIAILTDGQRLMLTGQMDFLTDTPSIRPEKLLAGAYSDEFRRYDDSAVNFQSGPVWLRIRIANNTSKDAIVLSLNDALYTQADVLYNRASEGQHAEIVRLTGGILQDGMTEDDMPLDERLLDESHVHWPYYDIGFRLEIPHDQARTIYLRLHTPYLLLLNPYISDEPTYSLIQVHQIAWGYWLAGIMAGVLVYLLMIALSVRGIPEVWYCASFVAVSFLILLYGRGYLFQYLSGENWLKLHLYATLFSAQAFTYVGFSRKHFNTQKDFTHVDGILKICQYLIAVELLVGFIAPVRWAVMGVGAMAFVVAILLSVCSVYVWANSTRHLTIYITGTVMFLFVCILATVEHMGYINLGGGAREAYQAGICIQAVLFAVALAERVNAYQKEQARVAINAAEAQAESRAKSSFLAKMSHELRTPMNGLLGMLQLLEKTPLNDQQKHYMHVMRNSGRMLLGVIDDVLDYSRIVAGQLRMENNNFNLAEEIAEIELMFSVAVQQKNLQLRFLINPNTPAIINSDAGRLRQILNNLVGNAIKFTERGAVTVRLWIEQCSDSEWLLHGEVEDTGIGIAAEQMQSLFREYSQADGGKNHGGSGLGLVICKQLVEMMGGNIHVESALGYGSVFHFFIEIKPPLPQEVSAGTPEGFTKIPVSSVAHVLVAEDNAINSEVIIGMLTQLGYHAECVSNGEDAVNAVCRNANHWNILLMDVEMPVQDGLAAAQKIRAWEAKHRRNAIPIIALTAHTMRTHGNDIARAGMNDYLSKPIDITLLKSMLRKWLPTETLQRSNA